MLIAMVRRVGGKRGTGSRWRFSEKTLRKVSRRAMLRNAFIEELQEELAHLGYTVLRLPNGGYGMIETRAFESWPLIAGRERLGSEVEALRAGNEAEFKRLIDEARLEFVATDQDEGEE
jgi:hypothetical protein